MDASPQKYWWALVLRGLLAFAFGLMCLFWTGLTLQVLVLWFGAYALVTGVFAVVGAFQAAVHHQRWWLSLLEGIVGILAGLFTFFWPGNTALILIMLIAIWAILSGIFQIGAAISAPWSGSMRALLAISGVLSVVFGVLIYTNPMAGAISITWIIGIYAIAFGLSIFVLGLRLKKGGLALAVP